jgi:hypothetical protein
MSPIKKEFKENIDDNTFQNDASYLMSKKGTQVFNPMTKYLDKSTD